MKMQPQLIVEELYAKTSLPKTNILLSALLKAAYDLLVAIQVIELTKTKKAIKTLNKRI
jgi:hypothetical protein